MIEINEDSIDEKVCYRGKTYTIVAFKPSPSVDMMDERGDSISFCIGSPLHEEITTEEQTLSDHFKYVECFKGGVEVCSLKQAQKFIDKAAKELMMTVKEKKKFLELAGDKFK